MPTKHVLQLKVTLLHVKPAVWRRLIIPEDYTFWQLHVAIQDAMGWQDQHLHEFCAKNPWTGQPVEIGLPDEDSSKRMLDCTEVPVALFLNLLCRKLTYAYDFGDGWEHSVELEQVLPRTPKAELPACVAGLRRCPPEDCGGPAGYENLLEIISNPKHPERKERLAWLGGAFDPDDFDPKTVVFEDPEARLQLATAPA